MAAIKVSYVSDFRTSSLMLTIHSRSYEQAVVVTVGQPQDAQVFTVHNTLVKAQSGFFRACLDGDWIERNEGKVALPEDDRDAFQTFVNWLYTKEVDVVNGIDFDVYVDVKLFIAKLATCYILGDKLQARRFRNDVLDAIIHVCLKTNQVPNDVEIARCYSNTQTKSTLRRLFVDMCTWYSSQYELGSLDFSILPAEFTGACFKDIATALHAGITKQGPLPVFSTLKVYQEAPFSVRKCQTYHEHERGEEVPCQIAHTKEKKTNSGIRHHRTKRLH